VQTTTSQSSIDSRTLTQDHRARPISPRDHLTAVLQALLVTFLWSTSWVLIKLGLRASLPPLTFAGLRYTLGFLCLAPFTLGRAAGRQELRTLSRPAWRQLAALGLLFYTITQGAQFFSLAYLPAATLTLLLNLTPLLVALVSHLSTQEAPTRVQWAGTALTVIGVLVYFVPLETAAPQALGLAAATVCLLANAASALLGRSVNAHLSRSPALVTTVSMGIGGLLLLVLGGATQGIRQLGLREWAMLAWLAAVNTAFAFTLWNASLRTLTAVESSLLNCTMLPQIALLAWIFLGEALGRRHLLGLLLVLCGALVVQLAAARLAASPEGNGQH